MVERELLYKLSASGRDSRLGQGGNRGTVRLGDPQRLIEAPAPSHLNKISIKKKRHFRSEAFKHF